MHKAFMRGARFSVLLIAAAATMGAAKPVIGEPAPPLQMTMIDGTKVTLEQLRGQVVLINFWATWCGPCKRELPILDAYYELQRKYGLRVFTITTEGSVPISQLKKLFAAMHITPIRSLKGKYAPINGAIPTNFIIDRSGRLRYAQANAFELDDLNRELVPLLRERPPADAAMPELSTL
ncbi:TlpA disulfide reductase family protein [Novosphingobium sp. Chol11]|uniref:TlpA family protein disulfide reductase n=1 Tax=Novosphingobium sp. Chol11 TaxID=1385763 RepID=UPI0025CD770A|nr:TlpA disulfide reductase family protein [Novosphingobium sp. Chol11]